MSEQVKAGGKFKLLRLCDQAGKRLSRELKKALTEDYMCIIFTRRRMEVNFPSADWLSHLRTQWTVFVGRVCLQSRKMFFNCSQILTVASFIIIYIYLSNKNMSANFLFLNTFFSRVIFVRSLHIFLILFRKCYVTFHWNWIWQIVDTFF